MAFDTLSSDSISFSLKDDKSLAVLTSGGDAQGMNAAIRSVARVAMSHNVRVYGIFDGYTGLVEGGDLIRELYWDDVGGIIQKGGTILGTARSYEFRKKEGRKRAIENILKHHIQYLCIIGGDGSLTGASLLTEEFQSHITDIIESQSFPAKYSSSKELFLNIIGIVGSIDNDMCDNDMTIGTDSALHRIMEAADSISSTAGSHQRVFIIQVMGRRCGHLALMSALASDADYVFLPEVEVHKDWEDELCRILVDSRRNGKRYNIIFVAEGAIDEDNTPLDPLRVKNCIDNSLHYDTRITILGHIQRGGKPSSYDRIYGSRLGAEAAMCVIRNNGHQKPIIIAVKGNTIIHLSLIDTINKTIAVTDSIQKRHYAEVNILRGSLFRQHLETFKRLRSPLSQNKVVESITIGILHVGAPAAGQNPTTCAFVKLAISFGHKIFCVSEGFKGLSNGNIHQLELKHMISWMTAGGSKLGTNRILPERENFKRIAQNLEKFHIQALVVVGGFEGFHSLIRLESARQIFPSFCIPMVLIPATISNNIPGTDYTLGSDTSLNVIQDCIDYLKQSASASRKRVFIVEVQGGNCGYLATMSALAGGADNAYIAEKHFDISNILSDIKVIVEKFKNGIKRGIIIRNEFANPYYTTEVLQNLYEAESDSSYFCRSSVLGHIQQGGTPSPLDRIYGCMLAVECIDYIYYHIKQNLQNSGKIYATEHSSVCVLGLQGQSFKATPVEELKDVTDFTKRINLNTWWTQLRVLMRVLSKHAEDSFEGENIDMSQS